MGRRPVAQGERESSNSSRSQEGKRKASDVDSKSVGSSVMLRSASWIGTSHRASMPPDEKGKRKQSRKLQLLHSEKKDLKMILKALVKTWTQARGYLRWTKASQRSRGGLKPLQPSWERSPLKHCQCCQTFHRPQYKPITDHFCTWVSVLLPNQSKKYCLHPWKRKQLDFLGAEWIQRCRCFPVPSVPSSTKWSPCATVHLGT